MDSVHISPIPCKNNAPTRVTSSHCTAAGAVKLMLTIVSVFSSPVLNPIRKENFSENCTFSPISRENL